MLFRNPSQLKLHRYSKRLYRKKLSGKVINQYIMSRHIQTTLEATVGWKAHRTGWPRHQSSTFIRLQIWLNEYSLFSHAGLLPIVKTTAAKYSKLPCTVEKQSLTSQQMVQSRVGLFLQTVFYYFYALSWNFVLILLWYSVIYHQSKFCICNSFYNCFNHIKVHLL
jgi:hypothetical protein